MVALSGILPNNILLQGIIAGWVIKTIVEVAFTPITYFIIAKVKEIEKIDHYDKDTNFNPFSIK